MPLSASFGALRRKRNGTRSSKRLSQASEHRQISVKLNLLQPTNAKRGQAVLVLEPTELALHGGAARVQITEPLGGARNERVLAVGLAPAGSTSAPSTTSPSPSTPWSWWNASAGCWNGSSAASERSCGARRSRSCTRSATTNSGGSLTSFGLPRKHVGSSGVRVLPDWSALLRWGGRSIRRHS